MLQAVLCQVPACHRGNCCADAKGWGIEEGEGGAAEGGNEQQMVAQLTLALLETASTIRSLVFLTTKAVENANKPCCSR